MKAEYTIYDPDEGMKPKVRMLTYAELVQLLDQKNDEIEKWKKVAESRSVLTDTPGPDNPHAQHDPQVPQGVDSAIGALSDRIDGNHERLNLANKELGTVRTEYAGLKCDIKGQNEKMNSLIAENTKAVGLLNELMDDLAQVKGRTEEAHKRIDAALWDQKSIVQKDINDSVEERLVSVYKTVDGIQKRLDGVEPAEPFQSVQEAAEEPVEEAPKTNGKARGERSGSAKLTERKVRGIRSNHAKGVTMAHLGRKYNVSPAAIKSIVTGKTWKHVK